MIYNVTRLTALSWNVVSYKRNKNLQLRLSSVIELNFSPVELIMCSDDYGIRTTIHYPDFTTMSGHALKTNENYCYKSRRR